jgi:hypothetical protein
MFLKGKRKFIILAGAAELTAQALEPARLAASHNIALSISGTQFLDRSSLQERKAGELVGSSRIGVVGKPLRQKLLQLVEREVQLQHVHAGLTEKA